MRTTQLVLKNNNTLLCYFPNGNVVFDNDNPRLVNKPPQSGDTCWFDGPMMLSNLLIKDMSQSPILEKIRKCKEETSALFLLKHCYNELVDQFDTNKLQLLIKHPNILSINFPNDFIERLTIAINSSTSKKILFAHLELAIKNGKDQGIESLHAIADKMTFESKYVCLEKIGRGNDAKRIEQINSLLADNMKYCDAIQILLKDSIIDGLLGFLTIQKCQTSSTPKQMYELLEQFGPILSKANFGIDSYKPNSEKCLHTIQNIRILGWDKENYIESNSSLHSTIIVGVKCDEKNPEYSRIYFLDPRQTMSPSSGHQQVYSVGFSKYMSKVSDMYFLTGYNLTLEMREILEGKTIIKSSKLDSDDVKAPAISIFPKNERLNQIIQPEKKEGHNQLIHKP